jgi:hypothetical protein
MAETPGHFFIHFNLGHHPARRILTGGEWDNCGQICKRFFEVISRCHDDPRIEVRKRSKRTMQCPASFLYFEPLFWGR